MSAFRNLVRAFQSKCAEAIMENKSLVIKEKIQELQLFSLEIESEFIQLSKLKHLNKEEYKNFLLSTRPQPFFSTSILIYAVVKEYLSESSEQEMSQQNDQQSNENLIDTLLDCFECIFEEYNNNLLSQNDQFVFIILVDIYLTVVRNVAFYISKYLPFCGKKVKQSLYIKTFSLTEKLLQVQKLNHVFNAIIKFPIQEEKSIEFYHIITYLIYIQCQCMQNRKQLYTNEVQTTSLQLSQLFYKFSVNFCHILQTKNILQVYLYEFINNINTISYGEDYCRYITQVFFEESKQLVRSQGIIESLTERRVILKMTFNQYYGISMALLFEVPNKFSEAKIFYLKFLEYQLKTQIPLVLSFREYLSKFIFYLRIERDPAVIEQIQICIVATLVLNQDPQLIKQLIEALSYHESSILMNDIDSMQLDLQDKDSILSAYRIANLPAYRIPLYLQKQWLLKLVDDMQHYHLVVKYILQVILQTYRQWEIILLSLSDRSNLIQFQGGQSTLQIHFYKSDEKQEHKEIIISMTLRLLQKENSPNSSKFLETMNLGFSSFLTNAESSRKLILMTLSLQDGSEIQLCLLHERFFIVISNGVHIQEMNFEQLVDFYEWFTLELIVKGKSITLKVQKQENTQNIVLPEFKQYFLNDIILGVKLLSKTCQDKFQAFLLDEQSFEGQICQFDAVINGNRLQFEQFFTQRSRQEQTVLNSSAVAEQQIEFDDMFVMSDCTCFIFPELRTQNIYVLDIRCGIEFFHNHGGYVIFLMMLDVLEIVYENNQLPLSEQLLLYVLEIIKIDLTIDQKQIGSFIEESNLLLVENTLKKWIYFNQKITNGLIQSLLEILKRIQKNDKSYPYVITIIKIIDNQWITNEQFRTVFQAIILNEKAIKLLSNTQLIYSGKHFFTFISKQKSSYYFSVDERFFLSSRLGEDNNLLNLPQEQCVAQMQNIQFPQKSIIELQKITQFLLILQEQDVINLFSLDLLQIIDVLLDQHKLSRDKVKILDDTKLLGSFNSTILQVVEKRNIGAPNLQQSTQNYILNSKIIGQFYELTFSIYFKVLQKLRQNSKKDPESQFQSFIDILLNQNQFEVEDCIIQKIFDFIMQYSEDQVSIEMLLRFLNQLYSKLMMSDQIKEKLTTFFLGCFKNHILKKQQREQLLIYLINYSDFPSFLKNLMPLSINKKQNSQELFTYCMIFVLEYYPVCSSQLLYRVHIESSIFCKDSFYCFLQGLYPLIIQLFANKKASPFIGIDDEKKLINIITSFLHIEQCFGEITDLEFVNWDLYPQVIEKGLLLFQYFNILFLELFPVPSMKDHYSLELVHKNFSLHLKKGIRVLPNGGIKRLMRQLIVPFVRISKMTRVILLYQELAKQHQNIEKLEKEQQIIDQKSRKLIKNLLENEFSLPLLNVKKMNDEILRKKVQTIGGDGETSKKQKKGNNNSKFIDLLVYHALASEIQLDDCILKNLQQIFQFQIPTQIIEWKNINMNQIENITYFQDSNPENIIGSFTQLNEFKEKTEKSQKPIQSTFDLTQIDQIRDETSFAIQIHMFMKIQIYYQFVHFVWLYLPKFQNATDPMSKTFSNLSAHQQSSLSDMSSLPFRDSQKRQLEREHTYGSKQLELWSFMDDHLQALYQELNKFIINQEFNFDILDGFHLKMQVSTLEDISRKRQHLLNVKMKNIFKPYLKPNKSAVKTKIGPQDESSSLDLSNQKNESNSFTIILQKSDNIEASLSATIHKRTTRRSSIKSEQVIHNISLNNTTLNINDLPPYQQSFRKESAEGNGNQQKYQCEYITQEGAYQGIFQFKSSDTHSSFVFTTAKLETFELFSSLDLKEDTVNISFEKQLSLIKIVHIRRFLLNDIAIEIFFQRQNMFFNFYEEKRRAEVIKEFKRRKVEIIENLKEEFNKKQFTQKWCEGNLTNFQYLMQINTYSGRSYNDLSQYFIFPWVISCFTRRRLDFSTTRNTDYFRDLKLPMGAIGRTSQVVIEEYQERKPESMEEDFMYGSHYSNAAIVFNYLIRLEPFNELHFSLQKNKFDVADRLFSNVEILWENSKRQDYKELIPEFYYLPEFLQNVNSFDFGTLQSAQRVEDVILPPWVKTQTAEEFIFKMRQALESEYVSKTINNWIDLIFGINNRGENAKRSANLFHFLTYEENIKKLISQNLDFKLLQSYLAQVYYFGQTPQQLFQKPHCIKQQQLQIFTNDIPKFDTDLKDEQMNVMFSLQNSLEIIGMYRFSEKKFYIIAQFSENQNKFKLIEIQRDSYSLFEVFEFKQEFLLPEIKIEGCNPQNLFTFIYQKPFNFGDGYDAQNHTILNEQTNSSLFFCLGGLVKKDFKVFEMKNKIQEIGYECSQQSKRQKRVSCVRYHCYNQILAVGSFDGLIQLFKVNFPLELKEIVSQQLKFGIICIDCTDIYILTIDIKNKATLMNIDGEY